MRAPWSTSGRLADGRAALTTAPPQAHAYAMIDNHTFRATGITAYLKRGGSRGPAAAMVSHTSTRKTQLYDQRFDQVSLNEVERVRI